MMNKYPLCLALFLLTSLFSYSQVVDGYFDDLAESYENGKYAECLSDADKLLNKKKYSGDPELYLYKAIAYNQISKDPKLSRKSEYSRAYREALDNLVRAIQKDRYGEYFPDNDFIIEDIMNTGLKLTDSLIKSEKYNKAIVYYRKMMRVCNDFGLYFMKAVLDIYTYNERGGVDWLEDAFFDFDAAMDTVSDNTRYLVKDGFVYFFDYLVKEEEFDSAKNVIKRAQLYFPDASEIKKRKEKELSYDEY